MKPWTFHNPENKRPQPEGYRFLTVEEAATIIDPEARQSLVGTQLLERLKPEYYAINQARWVPYQLGALSAPEVWTFRTLAPLPTEDGGKVKVNPDEYISAREDFVESFNFLAGIHHEIMVEKGFWNSRNAIEAACMQVGGVELATAARAAVDCQALALVTTEVSECVEAIRHGNPPDDKVPQYNGAEAEAADIILRIMDLAHERGWRLAEAVVDKLHMNASREKMHGGKNF